MELRRRKELPWEEEKGLGGSGTRESNARGVSVLVCEAQGAPPPYRTYSGSDGGAGAQADRDDRIPAL